MTIKDEMKPKEENVNYAGESVENKKEKIVEKKKMKKDVEKKRIDKLEKCVRDKDKRISKLEDTIQNVRTVMGGVGCLVSVILLIVGIIFLAKDHPDMFSELLKIFGVALIAFLIAFLIMIMLICLAGEKLSDDDNLSFSLILPILISMVVTLLYVLVTYRPSGM